MHLKRLKPFIFSLILLLIISAVSCKKDDSELKDQIAQLTARISIIEDQISQINSSVLVLQQAGKLNTDETMALKTLTGNLSYTIDDLKSSAGISLKDISDLKTALQQCASVVQVAEIKITVAQLSELVNSNFTDLNNENKNTSQFASNLQLMVAQLAKDLDNLKTIESIQELVGKIEKGGFTKGSLINFFEMDSTLTQTGRSFNTTITDNFGSFDMKVKNLKGKISRVVTDGFFFNEVSGKNSNSRITLTGLVKVDSSETLNINVLTHIERPRVEYLIKNGMSFKNAKAQAVTEVLDAFGITNPGINRSEKINLIGSAKRNNVLLAVSTLLVGFRSESQLTELLTDIAEDFKTDGLMNDVSIGNEIESHLYYLDTSAVINHVKDKYTPVYPDSITNKLNLSYIKTFQTNTSFTRANSLIEYPTGSTTTYNAANILNGVAPPTNIFEVAANIKNSNLALRVEITVEDPVSLSSYSLSQLLGTNKNWQITAPSTIKAILTTNVSGLSTVTFTLGTSPKASTKITIRYFEGNLTTPTKTTVLSYQ